MRVLSTKDAESDLGLSLDLDSDDTVSYIMSDYNSELAEIRNRYSLQNDIMVYCFAKTEIEAITQFKNKVKRRQDNEKAAMAADNEAYRLEKGQTVEEAEKEEQEYSAAMLANFKSFNVNTPAEILWAMGYGYGHFDTETSPYATVEEINNEGIVNNMKKHGYPTLGDAAIPHAHETITSYEIVTWYDNYDELWCETENHWFYFYCFYS